MTGLPIAITGIGMVTGVGQSAPASCAAIRCAIDNFQETRFMDDGGEWMMGCNVLLEQPSRGKVKLIKMAAAAIEECLAQNKQIKPEQTPLLLCLPEEARPGRVFRDNNAFFIELEQEMEMVFHPKSRVITIGQTSVGVAMQRAQELIHKKIAKHVIIAFTDSLLVAGTLLEFQRRDYILTSQNSDGFIPAEAGAAIVVEAAHKKSYSQLICYGIGFGTETAHVDSEEPFRADGLTSAIKQALCEAKVEMHDLDFRITDTSGKQYYYKEASLALSRALKQRKEEFDIWHPADCVGDTGVALSGIMLGVIKKACEKGYSKGDKILLHVGSDDGKRTAIILMWQTTEKNNVK